MTFGKLSVVLTEVQEKNLNKLDWFLTVTDNEIEKVKSFFERLELLDPQKSDVHREYKELILFKINQSYHLILSLEQNIYNSSFDYYLQHFGIYKNKNKLLEMKEMSISYQFESFLAQLKSLIDIFLKYIWKCKLEKDVGNKLNEIKGVRKKMDSFEFISKEIEILSQKKLSTTDYKNSNKKIKLLRKEKCLDYIFKNYDAFYNLKNYRDFIIHRGRIKQNKIVSQADRYIQFNYHIPKLQLTNNEYKIDNTHLYRLDFYCRLRYLELIYTIWKSLNELIDPEKLIVAKNEIKRINSAEVKEVLTYLGRKLIWNDKSFMTKEDIDLFLDEIGLKYSDLIVDREIKERQMKGSKSVKGEDMSYLIERTIYKPIRGFRFQKIQYNYDRDWKPKREKEIYGFTKASFTVDDMKITQEDAKKVLNIFIKLGLIIEIKEKKEIKYEFIDEELQHYIASLINLSQYKWSFIQYPQIEYFRKPKINEKKYLKGIYKDKLDNQLKKEVEKKNVQDEEYKIYKKRQKKWDEFKENNNLNVKTFKKNSLNYKRISHTWKSGLYKEIKDNWSNEYSAEGHFDIRSKDSDQIMERVLLLDYLHELNTNFKSWKHQFKGKKFYEIKKLAEKVFHTRRKHWLDLQKKWLKKSKKEYINMLNNEKNKFSKVKRKYNYLNHALKLINSDFYKIIPDLE